MLEFIGGMFLGGLLFGGGHHTHVHRPGNYVSVPDPHPAGVQVVLEDYSDVAGTIGYTNTHWDDTRHMDCGEYRESKWEFRHTEHSGYGSDARFDVYLDGICLATDIRRHNAIVILNNRLEAKYINELLGEIVANEL